MPRTKKRAQQSDWKGFVTCNLGKAEKDDARKWIAGYQKSLEDTICELVEAGYKVSFSQDRFHDASQTSLTCTDEESLNHGRTLIGRGPDLMSAFGMCLYKHFVMLDGDWSTREASEDSSDKWG